MIPNSEILLMYEARLCNPNGDPDEENRPRIDPKTRVNLVSDLRLKRFFRDYVSEKFGEEFVYVTKIAGRNVRADHRVLLLGEEHIPPEEIDKRIKGGRERSELVKKAEDVPKKCIDARLFGAAVPIGAEERGGAGASIQFIGPVQFSWGFSLHPVELVESSTITSIFAGREAAEQYGTMGKDWRLYYSLIAFYGIISGRRASYTGLSEDDIKILDNFLWTSLTVQPTTRSKIGEKPHLYLRIEYKDADTLLGDLRGYLDLETKETVRSFSDVILKFDRLVSVLKGNKDKVSAIHIRYSDEIKPFVDDLSNAVGKEIVKELPSTLEESFVLKVLRGNTI